MGFQSRNWSVAVLAGAVGLLACACLGQEEPGGMGRPGATPEPPRVNVDVTFGWGGCYRPMEWTPVEVGITCNYKNPLAARLFLSAQQDSLSVLNVTHEIVLHKDHNLTLPLVTKLAAGAESADASITDDHGRSIWSRQCPLADSGAGSSQGMTALGVTDALIGLAGRRGFGIIGLDRQTRAAGGEGAGRVYVRDKLPQWLPWDWTGYASLDLLVLYDPEWDKINEQQARAICQWVGGGGRLLVVLGGRPMPAGHPIAQMLPLTPGLPKKLDVRAGEVPSALATGVPRRGRGEPNVAVTAWDLADVRDKSWEIERFGLEPVLVSGPIGFGRAGVLLFDPAELTGPLAARPQNLWAWAMAKAGGERRIEVGQVSENTGNDSPQSFSPFTGAQAVRVSGQAQQATNRVIEHLLQIPELRPLSIWWVIGLLTVLALLLGPVDYLVLKRMDRLPMTWVTSSVIIAVFTAGAYYGVQALRAGSTQVRSVTVIDGIAGGPAWASSYSGIFASGSDDYKLEGLQKDQWWSGIAPTRNEEDSFSSRRSEEFSTRHIYCRQVDGGNLPYSLPISIWSMQCLLTEWPVAQMPFSAEVSVDGKGVAVDIDNKSSATIVASWVEMDGRTAMLSSVAGRSKTSLRADRFEAMPGPDRIATMDALNPRAFGGGVVMHNATDAQGTAHRTKALETYMKRKAAVVCALYEDAPCCCQVPDAKMTTNHLQLVRLVVWPKGAERE